MGLDDPWEGLRTLYAERAPGLPRRRAAGAGPRAGALRPAPRRARRVGGPGRSGRRTGRPCSVLVLDGRGEQASATWPGATTDGRLEVARRARRSRTRSACSTRRSPRTSASSAPATSTRSWRWRPTAGRAPPRDAARDASGPPATAGSRPPVPTGPSSRRAVRAASDDWTAAPRRPRVLACRRGSRRCSSSWRRWLHERTGDRTPDHGRRRRAQLRRQRRIWRETAVRARCGCSRRPATPGPRSVPRSQVPPTTAATTPAHDDRRARPRLERRRARCLAAAAAVPFTSARTTWPARSPTSWPPTGSSPGSRAAASSARGRSATARCWPTPGDAAQPRAAQRRQGPRAVPPGRADGARSSGPRRSSTTGRSRARTCSSSTGSRRSGATASRPSSTSTARLGSRRSTTRRAAVAAPARAPSRRRTGLPVVVNTSLNTAGRPMVDDPRDALELLRLGAGRRAGRSARTSCGGPPSSAPGALGDAIHRLRYAVVIPTRRTPEPRRAARRRSPRQDGPLPERGRRRRRPRGPGRDRVTDAGRPWRASRPARRPGLGRGPAAARNLGWRARPPPRGSPSSTTTSSCPPAGPPRSAPTSRCLGRQDAGVAGADPGAAARGPAPDRLGAVDGRPRAARAGPPPTWRTAGRRCWRSAGSTSASPAPTGRTPTSRCGSGRRGGGSSVGRREVHHPVRPAGPAGQRPRCSGGNADDALMRRLHGPRWRERPARDVAVPAARERDGTRPRLPSWPSRRRRRRGCRSGTGLRPVARGARPSRRWAARHTAARRRPGPRRVAPGPRTRARSTTMLWTSALIPPVATVAPAARVRGATGPPAAAAAPAPRAVLLDRDGTLVARRPLQRRTRRRVAARGRRA